jgi:2-C-methyl-D-erythritol 4-phosphate cytidylyltransferase
VTAQLNARGDVAVLVPAAGAGLRLGPGGPKALRLLAGEPLLVHAIRRVAAAASVRQIIVAAPAADVAAVRSLLAPIAPVTVVAGGAERQESVAIALAQVPAEVEIVLVHDAARALTPPELIEAVAAAVRAGAPAVIPVLPVVDTIKEVGPGAAASGGSASGGSGGSGSGGSGSGGSGSHEIVLGTVDRAALRSVQTPQGFRHRVLAAAHASATDPLTDDAGLVEKAGLPVTCIPGSELALKITRPLDLILAEALLHVP